MSAEAMKSVITCDLEGRIETFSPGAEAMFGWRAADVVAKKRVSLFSPGLVVLEHVPKWLSEASTTGAHESETVFVRRDGTPFAAHIRITPTKKHGRQVGYCGVTVARPEVDPAMAMPPISIATRIFRWLVVTRAPFLTAIVVPVLLGAAFVAASGGDAPFPWTAFGLSLAGGIALHVAANTFNDYFDWKSGTDEANTDYFLPYSGGSRSIELGLVTPAGLLRLAIGALGVAAVAGGVLIAQGRTGLLVFGLVGAASGYFYTAPPLRLVARHGLGELLIGLNFGPLATAGTVYALTGAAPLDAWLVGVPVGLLTTAILWINEFPDAESDAKTGKNHLVVTLGKARARWAFVAILALAFTLVAGGVVAGRLPVAALATFLAAPLAWTAARVAIRHYADRSLVAANVATIQLHAAAGLLLALSLALG